MSEQPETLQRALHVGQVIVGQYTIRQVHIGGFSEVGIAENQRGTKIALKVIRRDRLRSATDQGEVQRQFQQECNTWQEELAGCPYVAQPKFVSDHPELGSILFMECVDGPSLTQLRDGGRLSMSQTLRLGTQIARAMAWAHEKEVLHRDLKPSNVLLTRQNEVRLIDWGLVAVQKAAGFPAHSPGYSAPQRKADPALAVPEDDVFAFSVILYECLVGRPPQINDGPQGAELRERLLAAEKMLPDVLLGLIVDGLAFDPEGRPSFTQIHNLLAAEELQEDVARRELERPFCRRCGFVAVAPIVRCPVCDSPCWHRIPQAVRSGMVRIQAGEFTEGLSTEQVQRAWQISGQGLPSDEHVRRIAPRSPRQVFLPAFDIDVYPVTNADFERFCRQTNYPEPENFAANRVAFPQHPMVNITWKDALCYALWAGKRLPRPQEWEKTARGDQSGRSYPWGDLWNPNRCNTNQNKEALRTSEVRRFTIGEHDGRSPFGVADMVGNVREWLQEGRHFGTRGLRGGSWSDACVIEGLVSFQMDAQVGYSDPATGFRCAADIVYEEREIMAEGEEFASRFSG